MAKDGNFNYSVDESMDHIIDEKDNMFIAMRRIAWNNSDNFRLDIRKYFNQPDGTERMSKGLSFLTEEGPHNLAVAMVKEGFGDTYELLQPISQRSDFRHNLNKVLNGTDDEFYDASAEGEGDGLYIPSNDILDY